MKQEELENIIKKELAEHINYKLEELSATGGAAGSSMQYSTPKAFKNSNRAVKFLQKMGYKKVKPRRRPYSTKLFDYL